MPVAEYIVRARDESSAPVNAAKDSFKRLREEKRQLAAQNRILNNETKVLNNSFNALGTAANALNAGPLAGIIGSIESVVINSRKMDASLKNSAAALVAIGAAGVSAGAALSGPLGDLLFGPGEKKISEQAKLQEIIAQSMQERLAAVNSEAAKENAINAALNERVRVLMSLKTLSVPEFIAGANAINAAREANRKNTVSGANAGITAERSDAQDAYMKSQDLVVDQEKRAEEKRKEVAAERLDSQIAAIENYNQKERDGAAESMAIQEEMRVNSLDGFAQQQAAEDAHYEQRLRQIAALQLSEDQSIDLTTKAYAEHKANQTKIEKQQNAAILDSASQTFGNLANVAKSFGKKGFVAYKAFATAQAIIDTYKAANAAYSAMAGIPIVGPALGIAAAAAAIAAGLANVSAINSQKPSGQAHAGMDYVPREGSYNLAKGELVLDRGTSDKVRSGLGVGPMVANLVVDGQVFFRWMLQASRDGRLEISSKAIT